MLAREALALAAGLPPQLPAQARLLEAALPALRELAKARGQSTPRRAR